MKFPGQKPTDIEAAVIFERKVAEHFIKCSKNINRAMWFGKKLQLSRVAKRIEYNGWAKSWRALEPEFLSTDTEFF